MLLTIASNILCGTKEFCSGLPEICLKVVINIEGFSLSPLIYLSYTGSENSFNGQ